MDENSTHRIEIVSLKSGSVLKSVLFSRLQQPQKRCVDGLRCGDILAGQGVAVNAEGVHIFGVAYKLLDFPGGQRLDHAHEGVPQFVQAHRLHLVGSAEHFPALIIAPLCFQTEHAFTMPRDGPLSLQDIFWRIL